MNEDRSTALPHIRLRATPLALGEKRDDGPAEYLDYAAAPGESNRRNFLPEAVFAAA